MLFFSIIKMIYFQRNKKLAFSSLKLERMKSIPIFFFRSSSFGKKGKSFFNMCKGLWLYGYFFVCGVVLSRATNLHLFQISSLSGKSMQPTLEEDQIVLLNKVNPRNVKIDDIVSLVHPQKNNKMFLCKRVVALEGQVCTTAKKERIRVPKNHVWIEGDNKSYSFDSRHFGPIPKALIVAKISFRIYPFKDAKKL